MKAQELPTDGDEGGMLGDLATFQTRTGAIKNSKSLSLDEVPSRSDEAGQVSLVLRLVCHAAKERRDQAKETCKLVLAATKRPKQLKSCCQPVGA